jgi:hypothetical protein
MLIAECSSDVGRVWLDAMFAVRTCLEDVAQVKATTVGSRRPLAALRRYDWHSMRAFSMYVNMRRWVGRRRKTGYVRGDGTGVGLFIDDCLRDQVGTSPPEPLAPSASASRRRRDLQTAGTSYMHPASRSSVGISRATLDVSATVEGRMWGTTSTEYLKACTNALRCSRGYLGACTSTLRHVHTSARVPVATRQRMCRAPASRLRFDSSTKHGVSHPSLPKMPSVPARAANAPRQRSGVQTYKHWPPPLRVAMLPTVLSTLHSYPLAYHLPYSSIPALRPAIPALPYPLCFYTTLLYHSCTTLPYHSSFHSSIPLFCSSIPALLRRLLWST